MIVWIGPYISLSLPGTIPEKILVSKTKLIKLAKKDLVVIALPCFLTVICGLFS